MNRFYQYGYVAVLLAACTATTPAPTPSPTTRPTATPTSTPTPTETLYPGDVPGYPTLVHDPTPAGPLLDHGPWLLFVAVFDNTINGTQTISAINADGSGLSQVVSENYANFFAPSPVGSVATGIDIAYISGIRDADNKTQTVLKLLHLPDKSERVLTTNASAGNYASYLAVHRTGLVWSHDGRRIAFLGDSDDHSTDLYVYSLVTEQAIRITSASTSAIHAWWSPDDRYLIFGETDSFPDHFDGRYALWTARSDGSGRPWLLQEMSTKPRVFGWNGPHTALIGSLVDYDDPEPVIQQVDLSTGETSDIARGYIWDAAYNSEDHIWVMSQTSTGCDPTDGQFMVFASNTNWTIPSPGCGGVTWLDRAPGFLLYPGELSTRATLLTRDFNQIDITMPEDTRVDPKISDDGQYWAWAYPFTTSGNWASPGVWISERGANLRQIFEGHTRDFLWVPNSHTLIFGGYVGIYAASAPDFVPKLVVSYVSYVTDPQFKYAVWIP